jgi:hypothetical protein
VYIGFAVDLEITSLSMCLYVCLTMYTISILLSALWQFSNIMNPVLI